MTVERAVMTGEPVDVRDYEELVRRAEAGAVVSFAGVVRDHDHGREVSFLEYDAHPSASDVIGDIAATAAARNGVLGVAVAHRHGRLDIGDAALVCAVSAVHRAEAFETCQWLVDEVKKALPVWKRQVFADGSDEWVNCP